ncbi:hypothetical protein GJAV_G00221560 [Gymnothorax javanicus]|nr:hypothetical protein GJAV_G00221560 [Gymnothorax javanicus]
MVPSTGSEEERFPFVVTFIGERSPKLLCSRKGSSTHYCRSVPKLKAVRGSRLRGRTWTPQTSVQADSHKTSCSRNQLKLDRFKLFWSGVTFIWPGVHGIAF